MPEYCGAEKAFLYSSPVLHSPHGMFANAWLPLWSLLLPSPRESDSSEKVLGSEQGRASGAVEWGVFSAGAPSPSLELCPTWQDRPCSCSVSAQALCRCVGNLVSPRVRVDSSFRFY